MSRVGPMLARVSASTYRRYVYSAFEGNYI
jgi:hypothetical protein